VSARAHRLEFAERFKKNTCAVAAPNGRAGGLGVADLVWFGATALASPTVMKLRIPRALAPPKPASRPQNVSRRPDCVAILGRSRGTAWRG